MSLGSEIERGAAEQPIAPVRGTRDWLPGEFARMAALESLLLDRFARAGYAPLRTPVLEPTELHERKSGAAIVSRLYELADHHPAPICLRPELTAGIVRAYTAAPEPPPLPWRVGHSGPVFRREKDPRPGRWREFHQVGVELIGASGPAADGEVIWLASWALAEAGVRGATIRLGHVGLILEMLRRSGLPGPARAALVQTLSHAAAEGGDVSALETAIDGLADWLSSAEAGSPSAVGGEPDDGGVDRLFRTLVPVVNGRRPVGEIVGRLRRKWDLGHSLLGVLDRVRGQVRALGELKGPPGAVLERLARDFDAIVPESIAELRTLVATLGRYDIDPDAIELDLGFGRGIGFYSQMIFELVVPTAEGPMDVCGGGRYDGLAKVLGSDRDDRGIGFAFGLERLLHVMNAGEGGTAMGRPDGFLVLARNSQGPVEAARLAISLREQGARAVVDFDRSEPEAIAHAASLRLARVVALVDSPSSPNPLAIHDVARGTVTRGSLDDLGRLARADAEGRRR